jgi:hypothetical protein
MRDHPYSEFESHPLWAVVDSQLSELEENQDIQLTTSRELVVGSIVKACVKKTLENPEPEAN